MVRSAVGQPSGRVGLDAVDDVAAQVAADVRRDGRWWGVRPVVVARVNDDLVGAVRRKLPGAWVVPMPAGRPLQEAIDEALRRAGPAAPDTPRYDALTAVVRRAVGATDADDLLDRRRLAARRERWRFLLEPITLFWILVATLGATTMSAASVKEFGRGDLAWNVGTVCLLSGVAGIGWHLAVAAWRLVWWSIRAVPTEQELARALLRDLRHDWRRILPNGWFRARDVPQQLPVLLVAASPPGPVPSLLAACLRGHSPRLPRWLWWLIAAVRRPAAVVVTDYRKPGHVPVADQVRSAATWVTKQPERFGSWWRKEPGPTWRRLGVLAAVVLRWLVAVAAPAGARRRAVRLLQYGVVVLLLLGSFYLDRSPNQPYCLWRAPGSELSTDASAGEWIGYRSCLGWGQLGADIVDGTVAAVASPLTVHRPGPDDDPHLFDVNLIYRENKRVERLADGRRPVITIAMVTSLTAADPTRPVRSVVAERENLAGAYAAQMRINTMRSTRRPYVRLAVVNAGDLTRGEADPAVREHLTILEAKLQRLARDPTLAAAIVTVYSTRGVQNALRDSLGVAGVAMVSPTMSADGFGAAFGPRPLFFQVNSTNDDQVQLIYQYARSRHRPLVFFYPVRDKGAAGYGVDGSDLYVTSLYCDVQRRYQQNTGSFHGPPDGQTVTCPPANPPTSPPVNSLAGTPADGQPATPADTSNPPVPVSMAPWTAERPPTELTQWACPPSAVDPRNAPASSAVDALPLVFFGGRYTDVAEFTQALRLGCANRMPEVAVADSSARFLADREQASHVPHGAQVLIAYRGRVLTCDTLRNPRQAPNESSFDVGRRADFYDDISGRLHRCATGGGDPEVDRWLAGGWAALGYDSLLMINDALLRAGVPDARHARGNILQCLRGRPGNPCDSTDYPGAYGAIHIDDNGVGRRPTVLLRVKDLATAFESPATVDTVATCVPQSTPCTAHIEPDDAKP